MDIPIGDIKPYYEPPSRTHKNVADSPTIQKTIQTLNLRLHPEGGFFVETDRSLLRIPNPLRWGYFIAMPVTPYIRSIADGVATPSFTPIRPLVTEERRPSSRSWWVIASRRTVVPGFEFADHDFLTAEMMDQLLTLEQVRELKWMRRKD
ncbi:RmlC-like cupin domain-containing protein [Aspergillus affinis]|uniref:RmlC-like cupin domain-containing protein n=1 Tax=Aspergillus affinis TaxID=1070780 RepID=UPI0022FEE29F|nr:RmlC-like cupin domain-containing protein [Aspergillus affinis]KAI9045206.1 RmlC-like cupin domain-containing protein [Aspergillus affinis]